MNFNGLFVWENFQLNWAAAELDFICDSPKCLMELKNRWVYNTDEYLIYWEGNFFGNESSLREYSFKEPVFWEFLKAAITTNPKELLNLNGVFHGLLWEKKRKALTLFNDRHGLKPVYFSINEPVTLISFASPVDIYSKFELGQIDLESTKDFLDSGVYWSDTTPFKNVKVLPPATILEFDNKGVYYGKKYWNWSEIPPIHISLEDAILTTSDLTKQSILNRQSLNYRNITPLSGGMDSRLIFDVLAQNNTPQECYTFGDRISGDIYIARKVLENTKINHRVFFLEYNNWLNKRSRNFNRTFGFAPFFDLHGYEEANEILGQNEVLHSGFLGDAIIGDTYINRRVSNKPDLLNRHELMSVFGSDIFEKYKLSNYIGLRHLDYIFIDNSARKNVLYGILGISQNSDYRLPFLDHKLVDFLYGIPENHRKNRTLYNGVITELMSLQSIETPTDKNNFSKWYLIEKLQKAHLKIMRELQIPHAAAPMFNYHKAVKTANFKATINKGMNFVYNESGLFSRKESQQRLMQLQELAPHNRIVFYSRILAVYGLFNSK